MQRLHVLGQALCLIVSLAPLGAQTTSGSIVGTVTDPSGAVIVKATVAVTNMDTLRISAPRANDGNPSWSRDGRWIYFDSMRTGEQQVWKMPAKGGEAVQLTRDGGVAPLESPDGKFLYYSQWRYPASVWRIPVEGGTPTKILDALSDFKNLAIADNGLYFIPRHGFAAGSAIQFLSFTKNQIRPLTRLEKPIYAGLTGAGGELSVSPDGRWILYTQIDQADFELMMVENFR
jgi:Tol biopolymer transport system component